MHAQECYEKENYVMLRVNHENDFLPEFLNKSAFPNRDDNYTGAMKIEFMTNLFRNSLGKRAIFNPLGGENVSHFLTFGVAAFTPQHLEKTQVITDDRPYASYRYWGFGTQSINRKGNLKLLYELDLGSMGRPIAGDAQTYIHEHNMFGSTRPIPQGWGYEIAEGGKFAFNITGKLDYLLYPREPFKLKNKRFNWLFIVPRFETNLGNYMINAAVAPRIYLFNLNYNFADLLGEPSQAADSTQKIFNKSYGFYFYATPRLRYVAHNATLTGKWVDRNPYTRVEQSEINKLLTEYDFGVQVRLAWLHLGYEVNKRSKEFSYAVKDRHYWGKVYLSFFANW